MAVTTLRIIITVVSFVSFLGIVIWVMGKHQKRGFDEAAKLPFQDE